MSELTDLLEERDACILLDDWDAGYLAGLNFAIELLAEPEYCLKEDEEQGDV